MTLTVKLYKDDDMPFNYILRHPMSHPDLADVYVATQLDTLIDEATIHHAPDAAEVDRLRVYIMRPETKYGSVAMSALITYCIAYRLNLTLEIYDEGVNDFIAKDLDFGYL